MQKLKNRMKHGIMFLLLWMGCIATISAQQKTIKGTITEAKDGEPVIGASVSVKGTSVGTVTDIDGNFTLSVPENGKTLVISYLGLATQEIPIDKTVFSIALKENVSILDEVVVIGYGTVKRRDLTGAVASISAEDIANIPVSSVSEALTGKMAGVQVTTTEGSPDAEVKIRVRGGGSINTSSAPLYIVDGFPVNSISDVATSEIASVEVLKDASSTAIYGARGANGVILITTKSGKDGKITASYDFYGTFKNLAKKLPVLSPYEFAKWQYELANIKGKYNPNGNDNYVKRFGLYDDIDLYRDVDGNDWQNIVFGNTGTTFNHSVNVTGGNDYAKFSASYNRIDDKAIMLNSTFQRDNLNLKATFKPMKELAMDFLTRYSATKVRGSGANEQNEKSSSDARLKHVMIYSPIPLRNLTAMDDEEETQSNLYPPTTSIYDNDQRRSQKRTSIQGGATWEIIKGFKLRSELGIEQRSDITDRFYGLSTYFVGPNGQASVKGFPASVWTNIDANAFRNTNTLNMNLDKYIPKAHSLTVLLGQEIIVNEILTTTMEGQGFPDFFTAKQAWNFMNYRPNSMTESGTTVTGSTTINNYYGVDDRLASFFGRVNYNFKDRYLLSATMRADGSSRFYKGNQWGYFPSGAFAWRLSEEDFMKNVQWLDNLKWRLSFGAAGNNNIPGGQTQKLMSSRSTSNLSTAASIWTAGNTLDNPDLRWETMITRNTGIDFNLFNFRLGGTVDLYWNNTKDLLLEFPIAGSGYATQFQNMGKAENKGVEITLNGTLIQTRKITLDANFNIGFNKSRVVSLGNLPEITASSGWASSQITYDYKVLVGQSLGVMYGYITDGRYSADNFDRVGSNWVAKPGVVINEVCPSCNMPGGLKLKDVAGDDGIVNKDDIVEIGNATPKFTGGFGLNVKGFGFDLSTFFTFVYGNNIYNANKIEWTSTAGYDYRNMLTTMESGKRWTFIDESGKYITDPVKLDAMNANTTMWSPYVGNFLFHSWAVEDGSFLRCNNITLGYTLPKRLSSKAYIQSLRLYCTLSNVFIITNYTGFDPEVDTRRQTPLTPGVDYSAYPRSKGTTLGINMTF